MTPQEREIVEANNLEISRKYAAQYSFHKTLVGVPTFTMRSDWEAFAAVIEKGFSGKTLTQKERKFVAKVVSDAVSLTTDARTPGGLANNVVWQNYAKYASQLAVPGMPAIIDAYNIGLTADMSADMNWMRAYRTLDMRGVTSGKITNFFLHTKVVELAPNAPVPYTYIGATTEENVSNGRYGGGFAFDRNWLATNGFIQMNDAIMALREGNDITKTTDAYGRLYANIPATEAFDTDTQTTFNKGYYNLCNPLRTNNGYGITATSQVLCYYNPIHAQKVVNAMFARRGAANDTNEVMHNIVPIPTFDIPAQLQEGGTGTAHDAVLFVLPGRRILHLPQGDLSENTALEWEKNVVKTGIQDFYKNEVMDTAQTLKVRLGA